MGNPLPPRSILRCLTLLAAFAGVGCTSTRMDFHTLPSAEAFASIQPGVTTRSQVLQALGPPEEMRRLANFDRARRTTPQHRRVLEGGDVFGTRAYTYAAGQRSTFELEIVPFGPSAFSYDQFHSREDRWRIEFDDAGVVTSVSHVDEIGGDR